MKKLLVAAVALVALAGSANAGELTIPAKYHGQWCQTNGNSFLTTMTRLKTYLDEYPECTDHWNIINISAHSYGGWEEDCRPTKVRGNVFTFDCSFGEAEWKIKVQFSTSANGQRLHIWQQAIGTPKQGE
jgi:hypothetical protein